MFHTLPVEAVLSALKSALDGLSADEVQKRRIEYGFNELPKEKRSLVLMFLRQFHDAMVYILFGALAFSVVMPFFENGGEVHFESFLDAFVILAILILNAALGFVQEYKAEEAIAMLKELTSPVSRVRRDGEERMIPSRELVPGDIVILESGDKVSADGRLLAISHFEVNESSLTGESQPVKKSMEALARDVEIADRQNSVFAGTLVTMGSAEVVVTAIGVKTGIGKIADMVAKTIIPETPLEQRMKELGKLLGVVVILLCAVVVVAGLFMGRSFVDVLLIGASLAVSAVPEGLPAVVTVCMALGVRRMVGQNALVRRLEALEALGSVTVICADKTGTITENRMKVVETFVMKNEGENLLALIGASCNRATLPDLGDPTEIGLLEFAKEKGAERLPIDEEIVPFTSENKFMKTRHGDKVFLKGAPERIVELMDGEGADELLQKDHEMAAKGLRVLACAAEEQGTTRLVGLVAMEDPPRPTVKQAIEEAKQAGIRTIMITGDHIETAKTIARQVGIEGEAFRGGELDDISMEELCAKVKTISIFARVSPSHKVKILKALECRGQIVAMSGDGVNDAPALKGAHVGVAMGKNGTEVAREAASIVLADDHYATIVAAVREGRRIYDNIRKFVLFLLRSNFDEILFIMTTMLLGMPLPYLPLHILWINLMTDSLPALALGVEPAEPDIMRRPPRDPKEHILSGQKWKLIIAALWGFSVSMGLYTWQLGRGVPIEQARAGALMLAVSFELFLVFSTRSRRPIFQVGLLSNRWMLGAVTVPFALQFLLIFTPLRDFFHLLPLTALEWVVVFVLAISGFVMFELLKLFPKKRILLA